MVSEKKFKEQNVNEVKKFIFDLTSKKHVLFLDKCRYAAELLMLYFKGKGFENLVLQEEGGWYTYEKSGKNLGLNVLFAPMNKGVLVKEEFPYVKGLVFVNSNPGYAYVDDLSFYDEIKKAGSIIVNDVVCSIGEEYAKKGDFVIGSFGKDKPLSISSGGAFIASDDEQEIKNLSVLLREQVFGGGEKIDFQELVSAFHNFKEKKRSWINYASNLKKVLEEKKFSVLNKGESINVLVKTDASERENLIKFCEENNLQYRICPLYIRTNEEAISIEVKRLNLEGC